MGFAPLTFSGLSKYSQDFQTIFQRAADIANIPVKGLQNEKADVIQRKSLASSLSTLVSSFATGLQSLGAVGNSQAVTASSSDTTKATITGTSGAFPTAYTLSEITSLAAAASEASLTGYASSTTSIVSASGTVRLTFGSQSSDITLTPAENNLTGLRDKINALGWNVQATILTTGTGATPNYLSLSSTATGATTLTLVEDPAGASTSLITSTNQGANASFKVNGVSVTRSTNLVTDVIPGISFKLVGTTTGSATVTLALATDRGRLSTALKDIVEKYNNLSDFIDTQIGVTAGLLSGSALIRLAQSAQRTLTAFEGTGSVRNLAGLGISLDNKGKASFEQASFDALTEAQLASALTFAGTTSAGIGSLVGSFTQISDPISGLIALEQDQYNKTEDRLSGRITELTERIERTQKTLNEKLQKADALLAGLDSQQKVLAASLQGLNLVLFGRRNDT